MNVSGRRRFLGQILGGGAAAALSPALPLSAEARAAAGGAEGIARAPFPPPGLAPDVEDERYWRLVREQFPMAADLVLMNAANLCPSPFPVQETVFRLTRDVDTDASSQNRAKLGPLREAAREAVAAWIGADPDEIAVTRNTSESNNTVVSGVELGPGDEVVVWDQNHPTNLTSWEVKARRRGFTVRQVTLPEDPASPAELAAPLLEALGPRTRVLAFSHVSNATGVLLPAKELCRAARERGVLTLLDGAQSCGALAMDVHDIGCDFYTASAHKWPMGPKEAGILYVRREVIPDVWAADVGVGWESALEGGARKFESLGQRDDAAVAAVGAAVAFHQAMGAGMVEERIRHVVTALRAGIERELPGTRFHTPADASMNAGVLVFTPPGMDIRAALGQLYREHRVGAASQRGGIRLSPHVYNTMADVDRVVSALGSLRS